MRVEALTILQKKIGSLWIFTMQINVVLKFCPRTQVRGQISAHPHHDLYYNTYLYVKNIISSFVIFEFVKYTVSMSSLYKSRNDFKEGTKMLRTAGP